MTTAMTDAEAWEILAIMIEEAGTLPEYWGVWFNRPPRPMPYVCEGLCNTLASALNAGWITTDQWVRMGDQLVRVRPARARAYWWPPRETAPRVKACRRLARMVQS